MKKILLVGVIILLAVTVSGCKNAAEKTAETAIESSTGGAVDVDIDNDSMKINTNGGSLEVGEGVSLPDGFPSDVYVIDGTIISAMTLAEGESYSVSIRTSQTTAAVKEEYENEFKDEGWEITMDLAMGGGYSMSAEKDNRMVLFGVSTGDDGTIVTINTSTTE